MNRHPLARATAAAALAVLLPLLGTTSCAADDPASATTAATPTRRTSAPAPQELRYVAFGDSWPYGGHCGLCETFTSYYATYLEDATGLPVDYTNLTTNGGDALDVAETLETDASARAAVAAADIVVIATGINALDRTLALDEVAAGTCGGDGSKCLREMKKHWRTAFQRVMTDLAELTDGRAVAIRLVGTQNIFLSDPSIIADYGLPEDFARNGGELLTRELRDALCHAGRRLGAVCLDVWTLFNGPEHDQPWDENAPEAHQAVAQALVDIGLAPLKVG